MASVLLRKRRAGKSSRYVGGSRAGVCMAMAVLTGVALLGYLAAAASSVRRRISYASEHTDEPATVAASPELIDRIAPPSPRPHSGQQFSRVPATDHSSRGYRGPGRLQDGQVLLR